MLNVQSVKIARGTMRLGYKRTITKLQIILSTPKNPCQNFPIQKNPEIKIFKPKKIRQSSLSLEIRSTPWGCVQLQKCYPLLAR